MNTRESILEVAYDLFIKNGYQNTTLRDIAEVADVNLGLIPYYFKTKTQICIEVYAIMMKRILKRVDYDGIPLKNSIERYYYSYLIIQYYLIINPKVNRFYVETLETADFYMESQPQTYNALAAIIADYDIDLSNKDLKFCYYMMIGVERSLVLKKRANNSELSYFDINEAIVNVALNYIGVDKMIVEEAIKNVNKNILMIPFDWSILD